MGWVNDGNGKWHLTLSVGNKAYNVNVIMRSGNYKAFLECPETMYRDRIEASDKKEFQERLNSMINCVY